jgi:hypothetical protein
MSGKFQGRTAEPKDAQLYFSWLKAASDVNLVSTECYSYPTCNTVVVEKDGEPVLMNSFHLVIQMEALAPKPSISPKDNAMALRELHAGIRRVAQATGVKEIFFTCSDPTLIAFLDNQEANNEKRNKKGFKRVKTAVYKYVVGTGKEDAD